jgi:hypothetical protein
VLCRIGDLENQPTVLTLLARYCPCLNSLAREGVDGDGTRNRTWGWGGGVAIVRSFVVEQLRSGESCSSGATVRWERRGGAGGFRGL